MRRIVAVIALLMGAVSLSHADSQPVKTIEGYWQDVAGRTLFQRNVPPDAKYGDWHERELDATYPQAKQIRRQGEGYALTDMNYSESEYSIQVTSAKADAIDYVRQAAWSPCSMQHSCRLVGDIMHCALTHVCKQATSETVEWRGEERYVRRAQCERDGKAQLQGIPVKCR